MMKDNPLLIINGITIQSLPHSLIETTLSMSSKERQESMNKILDNYKVSLYKDFKNGVKTVNDLLELVRKG